jgi:hypothetical protein
LASLYENNKKSRAGKTKLADLNDPDYLCFAYSNTIDMSNCENFYNTGDL